MQVALPGCLLVLKLAARAGCGYNVIEVWVVNYLYMITVGDWLLMVGDEGGGGF